MKFVSLALVLEGWEGNMVGIVGDGTPSHGGSGQESDRWVGFNASYESSETER